MELPYTVEVYFAALAEYNRAWLPVPIIALLLSVTAFLLAVRPLPGRPEASGRFVGAILAAAWLWVGWAHQLQHMAGLNFMAPVYGWAWIAQGALIALTCTAPGRVRFRFVGDLRGWTGLVLALFGLLGYPLAVLALGYGWRGLPLVGTAPDPTAIFTAGLLAAARERPPLHLFVLPVAWAGVAAVSAYLLGFPLDYAVAVAVFAGMVLAVGARLRRTPDASRM
jgi:hypothetical protein